MPPPPVKRQKRNVVLGSEDEDVPTPPSKSWAPRSASSKEGSSFTNRDGTGKRLLPTRLRTKEKIVSKLPPPATKQPSPPFSPEERSRKPTQKAPTKGSLHAFFNTASQAPPARKEMRSEKHVPVMEEDEEEDIIEDDSADESSRMRKVSGRSKEYGAIRTVLDRRKPLHEQTQNATITASQEKPISASQQFLTVGKAPAKEASTQTKATGQTSDTRPWAEKYGPTNLEELMVHKKKVADVRGWLEGVLQGRDRKVFLSSSQSPDSC